MKLNEVHNIDEAMMAGAQEAYATEAKPDAYTRDQMAATAGFGRRPREHDTGDDEPKGVFTVVIDGRDWKTATSNEAFRMANAVAHKHPGKRVQVRWPTGQLNTVAEGLAMGMEEEFVGEPEHDGSTFKNSLHTIHRVAVYLNKNISDDDDIPEWVAEKMGAAKGMLTSVMQYLISEKEMHHGEADIYEQGVAEGLPQTLRKVVPGYAKREIDKKMDAGKFGKTDADKDANFQRYKKIQDKLKEQGVAEGDGDEAYVACIVQFNRSGRAMVQRTKPISHERAEEVIRNALAKNTFVHPPFMTIYPASAGKLDGSTIMAQFPDMSQKGVAEGQGNFDTAINNLHGWYEVDSSSPDIKEYEFDDREGGYYAQGTVKYSMSTGRVKIEFEDRSGQYGDDVNQTFNSIGDAMNVLRTITTQYRYNNGKAQKFDRLSHREPVTPDKLRKTDRTGRKGTISGAHSNDLKYSIQNNKGKLGPKGVLPEGQGVAEGLDKEPPDYAAMYENKLVEFAGGMGTGSVATAPGVGKGSNVGSLFGGSYSQKNSPFKKTKAKKESVIKR